MPENPPPNPDPSGEQGKGGGGEPPKTFTQEQVNSIVANAVREERGKVADYDDLKKAAERLTEIEDSQKSELEKIQGQLSETEQKNTTLDSELQKARVEIAVMKAASGKFRPDAAVRLLDVSSLSFDDDGKPTEDSVDKAIGALVEQYPELAVTGDNGRRMPAPTPGQGKPAATGGEGDPLLRSVNEKLGF